MNAPFKVGDIVQSTARPNHERPSAVLYISEDPQGNTMIWWGVGSDYGWDRPKALRLVRPNATQP